MSWNFSRLDSLTGVLAGAATVAAVVVIQSQAVLAKTSQEIARIAVPTTVQIKNTSNIGSLFGSGAIIARQGNTYTVVTANHVVGNPNFEYLIRTHTGQEYPVTAVQSLQLSQTDPDLAVVKFESPQEYRVATFGDSEQATVGADIYVSGYPMPVADSPQNHEFTRGMVTSRPDSSREGYTLRYEAVTRRGMSGGPVFDASGRVVGIHGRGDADAAVANESGGEVSIKTGFNAAIPGSTFISLMSRAGLSKSDLTMDESPPETELSANEREARTRYIEGRDRADRGDFTGAIQAFEQARELNPEEPKVLFYQANARFTSGDYAGAIQDYTQALRSNPNYADAYYNRGWAHYRGGQKQKALEDYNEAVRLDPTNAIAYFQLGIIREDLGDPQGAMQGYSQAIAVNPNYGNAYYNRGILHYYQRDNQAAIEDFQRASEIFTRQGNTRDSRKAQEILRKIQQ